SRNTPRSLGACRISSSPASSSSMVKYFSATPYLIPPASAADGLPDPREMVEAVPKRVVLHEELTRQRRVGIQRDGGRAIERFVGERANGGRGRPAIPLEKIERLGFFDRGVLARVIGVQFVNGVPGDAGDR